MASDPLAVKHSGQARPIRPIPTVSAQVTCYLGSCPCFQPAILIEMTDHEPSGKETSGQAIV